MKYDPVNQLWYAHTLEEWVKAKGGHSGMSLPGSVATQLIRAKKQEKNPSSPLSGHKEDRPLAYKERIPEWRKKYPKWQGE